MANRKGINQFPLTYFDLVQLSNMTFIGIEAILGFFGGLGGAKNQTLGGGLSALSANLK